MGETRMSSASASSLRLDRENLYFGSGEAAPFVERAKVMCHCGQVAHYIASNKKGYCAKHKAAAFTITRKRSFGTKTTPRISTPLVPWTEVPGIYVTVHTGHSMRETVDGDDA
jgi:hypothetical protein